jgi:AbrB family looped-hinge helix DNA binding protein
MVNVGLTKISSKGQVVIPLNLRKNLKEGDNLIMFRDDDRIILKKVDSLSEQMKEDLEFARRTEEAMQRIESGKGIRMDFDDFLKEARKW